MPTNRPLIEEQTSFDRAVDAVVAWVEEHSSWDETLLIVSGDHETGYLTGPMDSANPVWAPIVNNGRRRAAWHAVEFQPAHQPTGAALCKRQRRPAFIRMPAGIDPVRGAYIDNAVTRQHRLPALSRA